MATLTGVPVPVRLPTHQCCNCGTQDNVGVARTSLSHVYLYLAVFGVERSLDLHLPLCPSCGAAFGQPTGADGVWAAGLSLAAFIASMGVWSGTDDTGALLLSIAGSVALGGGFWGLRCWWRRPAPPMTARSQPVRVLFVADGDGTYPAHATLVCTHNGFGQAVVDTTGGRRAGPLVRVLPACTLALGLASAVAVLWAVALGFALPFGIWDSTVDTAANADSGAELVGAAAATVVAWLGVVAADRWLPRRAAVRRSLWTDLLRRYLGLLRLALPVAMLSMAVLGTALVHLVIL